MATVINLPKDPRYEAFGELAKGFGTYMGNKEAQRREEEKFKDLLETFGNVSKTAKDIKAQDAISVINATDPKDLARIQKATDGDPVKMMQFFEKATIKANKTKNKPRELPAQKIGAPGTTVQWTVPKGIDQNDHKALEAAANKDGLTLIKSPKPSASSEKDETVSDWIASNKQFIDNNKLKPAEARNAARISIGSNKGRIIQQLERSVASSFNEDNQPIWGEAERKGIQVANGMYDTLAVIAKGNESELTRLWTQIATGVAEQENQAVEDELNSSIAGATQEEEGPGIIDRALKAIRLGDDEATKQDKTGEDLSEEQKKNLRFRHEATGKVYTMADVEETAKKHKMTTEEVIENLKLKRVK